MAPLRNRVLRLTRPEAPPPSDVLTNAEVGRRVILGGTQRAVAFVAANLLTVAGAVVLLRYLGVDNYGRYGTVLALVGVVQGISDAGLTATGTRELALCETDAERRDMLAHILGLRVALTAFGVVHRDCVCGARGLRRRPRARHVPGRHRRIPDERADRDDASARRRAA